MSIDIVMWREVNERKLIPLYYTTEGKITITTRDEEDGKVQTMLMKNHQF